MNEVLYDTVIIPTSVDFVYCNGKLLIDSVINIVDSIPEFSFWWEKNKYPVTYIVEVGCNSSSTYFFYTEDTSFVFSSNETWVKYDNTNGRFQINCLSDSNKNKEGDKMIIQYKRINGPSHYYQFITSSNEK